MFLFHLIKLHAGNFELLPENTELGTVNIIESSVPLIDPDKSGAVKTKEQITALPTSIGRWQLQQLVFISQMKVKL